MTLRSQHIDNGMTNSLSRAMKVKFMVDSVHQDSTAFLVHRYRTCIHVLLELIILLLVGLTAHRAYHVLLAIHVASLA